MRYVRLRKDSGIFCTAMFVIPSWSTGLGVGLVSQILRFGLDLASFVLCRRTKRGRFVPTFTPEVKSLYRTHTFHVMDTCGADQNPQAGGRTVAHTSLWPPARPLATQSDPIRCSFCTDAVAIATNVASGPTDRERERGYSSSSKWIAASRHVGSL